MKRVTTSRFKRCAGPAVILLSILVLFACKQTDVIAPTPGNWTIVGPEAGAVWHAGADQHVVLESGRGVSTPDDEVVAFLKKKGSETPVVESRLHPIDASTLFEAWISGPELQPGDYLLEVEVAGKRIAEPRPINVIERPTLTVELNALRAVEGGIEAEFWRKQKRRREFHWTPTHGWRMTRPIQCSPRSLPGPTFFPDRLGLYRSSLASSTSTAGRRSSLDCSRFRKI